MSALNYALRYAETGWPVLPIEPRGKKPLGGNGIAHATTDAATITGWYARWPDAGVGISLAPAGLAAIDVDPRNGGSVDALPEQLDTLTAATGGGGLHMLVRVPEGATLPGKLGAGIDLKHLGYIVVEPSIHSSGRTYGWIDWDVLTEPVPPIADAPQWLLVPPRRPQAAPGGTKYPDWLAELLRGDSVHDNALRLVGRMVAAGLDDAAIRACFASVLPRVAEVRGDDRARELMRELASMIRGARAKGFGAKPDAEAPDTHRNAPTPDPACLYGLIGDIARAGSETTEANAFAVALNYIVYLSAAVGRGSYTPVGNTWHHARLFGLQVGRSGRGRKGDAASLVHRIDMAVRAIDKDAAPQVHRGGLSTREGLALMIHDGWTQGKEEVAPIHDKRLCVFESEFANILHQGKRDGNTLSSALRDAWDGVSIKPATKSNRVWASNPHIGLMAAITPNELRDLMASRELTNGFANRFLIVWAERTKMLPFPQATPQPVIDKLARRTWDVIGFAGGLRFVEHDVHRVTLSIAAQALYAKLYVDELNDQSDGPLIGALMERRAPVLLRLAMLFALTDLTREVGVPHIVAALAWIRYWRESVKFIFSSEVDEAGAAETNETAEKIIEFLTAKGKATRWQLSKDCFQGNTSKTQLDDALEELLSATPARIVVETVPRPKGSPGRPTKFYELATKKTKSTESEHPRGFADDLGEYEENEGNEVSPDLKDLLRKPRTSYEVSNRPQSRANAHSSLTSFTSCAAAENAEGGQ